MREEAELKIHLAGCAICVTYQKQSFAINKMVKNIFGTSSSVEIHLDDQFKEDIQRKIKNRLNES